MDQINSHLEVSTVSSFLYLIQIKFKLQLNEKAIHVFRNEGIHDIFIFKRGIACFVKK